jgi:hypothetical protein
MRKRSAYVLVHQAGLSHPAIAEDNDLQERQMIS